MCKTHLCRQMNPWASELHRLPGLHLSYGPPLATATTVTKYPKEIKLKGKKVTLAHEFSHLVPMLWAGGKAERHDSRGVWCLPLMWHVPLYHLSCLTLCAFLLNGAPSQKVTTVFLYQPSITACTGAPTQSMATLILQHQEGQVHSLPASIPGEQRLVKS